MSLDIRPTLSALLRNRTGAVLVAAQIAIERIMTKPAPERMNSVFSGVNVSKSPNLKVCAKRGARRYPAYAPSM